MNIKSKPCRHDQYQSECQQIADLLFANKQEEATALFNTIAKREKMLDYEAIVMKANIRRRVENMAVLP